MNQTPVDLRVLFAAERTLLAWIRTDLALMGLGFLVARFDVVAPSVLSRTTGVAFIVVAVVFTIAAAVTYLKTIQRLHAGKRVGGGPSVLALTLAGLLAAIGVVLALYIWTTGA